MSRTAILRALLAICTGLLLAPALSAQGTSSTKSAPPRSAADALEASASPRLQASDWIDAARGLEQAARLRSANDHRVVNDLLGAATAYQAAGKLVTARRVLVEGARQALQQGEVYTAACAYVDAVRLSLQLRDEAAAFTYLDHARQLATSSRLTSEQTRTILAQVGNI